MRRLPPLLAAVCAFLAAVAVAQEEPSPEPSPAPSTVLRLPAGDAAVWLELTPLELEVPEAVGVVVVQPAEGPRRVETALAGLTAIVCRGGEGWGAACGELFLAPGEELAVSLERGTAVGGILFLDGRPLAGARVAAAPAGLAARTPFTMPLAAGDDGDDDGLVREVESAEDGAFRLPPLAAGDYFLEVGVPGGRVHRTDPFTLPGPADVRLEVGATAEGELVFPLGAIDLVGGLDLEVVAVDTAGEPLQGVAVGVVQGTVASDLATFAGVTGPAGSVELTGVAVEVPAEVTCRMDGRREARQRFATLPARVECVLAALASVSGRLVTGEEEATPVAGAVAVRPAATADLLGGRRRVAPADAEGSFAVPDLPAGDYELRAGAPGFRGVRLPFTLAEGEQADVGDVVLLPGEELAGVVVDARTDAPLAGARIVAVEPPGAVDTTSDAEGAFTVAGGGERLVLRFSSPAHATRRIVVAPERFAAETPLRVEMAPAGFVRVEIVDEATGRACVDCPARLSPEGIELRTDTAGVALSPPLAAGPYRVYRPRVVHLGSTVVEEGEAESRAVEVVAGETATVRFGETRRPVRVVLVPSPGRGWLLSARAGDRVERLTPEADGAYLVAHRPGEPLALRLHAWDAGAGDERFTEIGRLPPTIDGDEVTVTLPATSLTGRLTDPAGVPLAGLALTLRSIPDAYTPAAHTNTDPTGTFTIPHLVPGVYTLYLGDRALHHLSLSPTADLDLGTFIVPVD